jgi:hypothetical protein
MLTETSVEVYLVNSKPLRTLPDIADDPEDKDDRDGKAGLEEVLRSTITFHEGRADGDVELATKNLRTNRFQGVRRLRRKDNSSRGPCLRLQVHLRCR